MYLKRAVGTYYAEVVVSSLRVSNDWLIRNVVLQLKEQVTRTTTILVHWPPYMHEEEDLIKLLKLVT